MAVVCPTILAADEDAYREQMETVAPFAHRIQIDLTDGHFARHQTVKAEEAWWPAGVKADFHLMYQRPISAINQLLPHQPHLIIVQAEADGDFRLVARRFRQHGIKAGVALLPSTSPRLIVPALDYIDHVLIFSGDLGSFGGHADLDLLAKVKYLKHHKSHLEIGWDGGVTEQNASELILGGVDVLNVGGAIQKSDNPHQAYESLQRIADETGTT